MYLDGIPYGDCFAIEIRYVARRIGSCDLRIEVGCFVVMKKPCMFSKKIRAGTLTESKEAHMQVFEAIREACAKVSLSDEDEVSEADEGAVSNIALEEKVTYLSDHLSQILGKVVPFITEKAKNFSDGVDNLSLLCGVSLLMLLAILLFSRAVRKASPTVVYTSESLHNLSIKLENLSEEVRELKQMLQLVLDIIQDKPK